MTEKLDIFRVLNAANDKNREFYNELTPGEVKAFQPFLVMRWMSGTNDAKQILIINELLNPAVFPLTNHKQLLWQLLTVCNSGKKARYSWIKLPSKLDPSRPTCTKVIMEYYGYSTGDAVEALRLLTRDDVIELAEDMGWQKEEIAKIKKEIKSPGDKEDKPTKAKKSASTDDLFEY